MSASKLSKVPATSLYLVVWEENRWFLWMATGKPLNQGSKPPLREAAPGKWAPKKGGLLHLGFHFFGVSLDLLLRLFHLANPSPLKGAGYVREVLASLAAHLEDLYRDPYHYTPEHCLVNGGVPLFWWKKPCFKWAKCIF